MVEITLRLGSKELAGIWMGWYLDGGGESDFLKSVDNQGHDDEDEVEYGKGKYGIPTTEVDHGARIITHDSALCRDGD